MRVVFGVGWIAGWLFVGAVLGFQFYSAEAQPGRRTFEYKVEYFDAETAPLVHQKALNELGRQGWEFVTYMPKLSGGSAHPALFKR